MEITIVILTTFISSLLSSMSGGGASIINLPVFLSLGLSFPLATSIHKISSAIWVLPAAYNFLKGRKIDWVFLSIFSVVGLIGAYLGVLVAISVKQRYLEMGIGTLIMFLVIYTYFKKDLGLKEKDKIYKPSRKLLAYPFAISLGFYESIFGAGNAILLVLITFVTRGFDFVDALGYYFAVAFLWLVLAAYLFIQKGYYDISLTIPAIIGSTGGAYVGSKYARYKGNLFIKVVFMIIGGTLGLKLILGL